MTNDEYCCRLHELVFTCAMNQRYHQILARRWRLTDRAVRIAVLVMAVLGLVLTIPDFASAITSLGAGIISLNTSRQMGKCWWNAKLSGRGRSAS
jgi:hypothetical protein